MSSDITIEIKMSAHAHAERDRLAFYNIYTELSVTTVNPNSIENFLYFELIFDKYIAAV